MPRGKKEKALREYEKAVREALRTNDEYYRDSYLKAALYTCRYLGDQKYTDIILKIQKEYTAG